MDREAGYATINIRLLSLQQLFNSFDPSPFHDKELDTDAHDYIVGYAGEFPLQKALRLSLEIPRQELTHVDPLTLENAIHNYFSYRAGESRRRIRFLMREGRSALLIGLAFLVACTSLRQVAVALTEGPIIEPLSEGLLILGWVAMWRPIQIFLYDWWPVRQTMRIYAKLAVIPVDVKAFD